MCLGTSGTCSEVDMEIKSKLLSPCFLFFYSIQSGTAAKAGMEEHGRCLLLGKVLSADTPTQSGSFQGYCTYTLHFHVLK